MVFIPSDDPRAWGRNLENQALAMWTAITGDPLVRLEDYAKVDALVLPHLNPDCDPGRRAPYYLEVHGRRSPLLDSPSQRISMKSKVYEALVDLSKITKMTIIWVVVGPDVILNLPIPTLIDCVADHRVYFDASRFGKLESPENRKFFEGSF